LKKNCLLVRTVRPSTATLPHEVIFIHQLHILKW